MADDIRILRLEKLALHRASEVVLRELADPRLTLVTLTRVSLAKDLSYGTVYWSSLGTPGEKSKAEHALRDATGVVQSEVAKVFRTRRSPKLRSSTRSRMASRALRAAPGLLPRPRSPNRNRSSLKTPR